MGFYELINQPNEDMYPLVNVYITMEHHHLFEGKSPFVYGKINYKTMENHRAING